MLAVAVCIDREQFAAKGNGEKSHRLASIMGTMMNVVPAVCSRSGMSLF